MAALVTTALIGGWFATGDGLEPAAATTPPDATSTAAPGVLYGRVTTADGELLEGRLRWGQDQEAFWNDFFDGTKKDNAWAAHAPHEDVANTSSPIQIFGIRVGGTRPALNLRRLFMSRFGDLARIEAHFSEVQVTLKNGTAHVLNRFDAGDIDDGVRVWDSQRGVVDLDARQIRTIEFSPTPPRVTAPERLHGTVRTRRGEFIGFLQWDRHDSFGLDELDGRSADDEGPLRFDALRSIARRSSDSALVQLRDGRERVLSGSREVSQTNRGISVDDARYGRVVITWDAFVRVDFSAGGSGPVYDDFPAGQPLTGSVTTRGGRRFSGRVVYDLDESETTDTFDGTFEGVSYAIPFSLIASVIAPGGTAPGSPQATVILRGGAHLPFERTGDFGDQHAGVLVFGEGEARPEYVAWSDVARLDFEPRPEGGGAGM